MVYVSEDTGSELSPDVRHGWANLSIASLQYPGPRPSGSASFRTRHPPTLSFTVGVRKRLGRLTLKSRLTCCWVLGGQPTLAGACIAGTSAAAPSTAVKGTGPPAVRGVVLCSPRGQCRGRRKVFDAHLDQDTIEAGLEPKMPEVARCQVFCIQARCENREEPKKRG